jgi:hypothetical protein
MLARVGQIDRRNEAAAAQTENRSFFRLSPLGQNSAD